MREDYLLLGILVLMIGGLMVFYGYTVIGEYQTFAGQLTRFFFASAQREYQLAVLITFLGIIFAIVGFGSIIYGAVAKKGEGGLGVAKEVEREISLYFQYCPLCYAKGSIKPQLSFGGKDYIVCSECAAKWHIYYGLTGFKWARLENVNVDSKGAELLRIEYPPEFWQQMALKGIGAIRTPVPTTPPLGKIYCSYCGAENWQDSTYCVKCGKKIKGS